MLINNAIDKNAMNKLMTNSESVMELSSVLENFAYILKVKAVLLLLTRFTDM